MRHKRIKSDLNTWKVVGSKICHFRPYLGKISNIDEYIFQMGWFNHQPEYH